MGKLNRYIAGIFLIASGLFLLGSPLEVQAAPRKVKASQLKTSTVKHKSKRTKIYCLGRTPGSIKKTKGVIYFTPFAEQIRKLTSRRDKAKKENLTKINKLAVTECKRLAMPTPTPTPTATPTPTSTPTFAPGNFDANGNVTTAGKILFGIPLELSANIGLGRDVQDTYCTGCHVERIDYTFPVIRYNIARPPMNYDSNDIPDAELANLVAYLNRFRF